MVSQKQFYEKYWGNEKAPPEMDPTIQRRSELLLQTLKDQGIEEGDRILDSGCGNGQYTYFLHKEGYKAWGVDISHNAIHKAKQSYPEVEFYVRSLEEKLPFDDKYFDAIWSNQVIEHMFDVRVYMQEMSRVLKPGGVFIITTPYHGLIKNLLIVFLRFDKHFDVEGGHIRFFTKKSLRKLLKNFKIIECKYIGRFWPISKSIYLVGKKICND